jgi:hypothetical protein
MMPAFIETIMSYIYLWISKLKKKPATQPVQVTAPTAVEPVTVETDDHPPTEPITVDVTVNEAKKDTSEVN